MTKKGVCCIVLGLEPLKFKTITFKSFQAKSREESLNKLGSIIAHNLHVTTKAIEYCGKNNLNYRLSSSLFPLITYNRAEINLEDLPNYQQICESIADVRIARELWSEVRLSLHPDQFNVLASENTEAVDRTIVELDFYSRFMTQIGCSEDTLSPINIHVNSTGDYPRIADRFIENYQKLHKTTQQRLVLENDDKTKGWSVIKLYEVMYKRFAFPITFDYLHHKCYPDGLSEEEAFMKSYETWGSVKPLFHYSESAPDQNNPRKHADYATQEPDTYGKAIDLDYEFKMKEKSW